MFGPLLVRALPVRALLVPARSPHVVFVLRKRCESPYVRRACGRVLRGPGKWWTRLRGAPMRLDENDITGGNGGGEGPADGGANPLGHDGGADGGAGEGPADGGANPSGQDGGADGGAGEGPADGGANPAGQDGGADGSATEY
ncbi:hypothetical protein GCM10023170_080490 [Phytohabitans houttuyneae]